MSAGPGGRDSTSSGESNRLVSSLQAEVELEEHDAENEEPWLISYADLMTLMFGFFAMLFTYASFNEDSPDYVKVRKELAKYFGGIQMNVTDKMKSAISSELSKTPGIQEMMMNPYENGVAITFMSGAIFESGSSDLKPAAADALQKLAQVIESTGKFSYIRVEGHSDDNPVHSPIFPSNWELSAARAGSVVRQLELAHIPSSKLGAIGYGSTRPMFPNRDTAGRPIPDNQAMNRRVVIKVNVTDTPDTPEDARAPASDSPGNSPDSSPGHPPGNQKGP